MELHFSVNFNRGNGYEKVFGVLYEENGVTASLTGNIINSCNYFHTFFFSGECMLGMYEYKYEDPKKKVYSLFSPSNYHSP